ncbi:lysozyme-like [Watersipora subatra]|uniref:lysozyme-like n=1 Tax=Watersipora subatra TaxID=2589382 RepID=UPI00355BD690
MQFVVLATLAVTLAKSISAGITDACISCLAKVELGNPNACNEDQGSPSCGVYQIKLPYWQDCYEPGNSLEECAFNEQCAKDCVRDYTSRYAHLCKEQLDKDRLSCEDYGRMHNGGGPSGCRGTWTLHYVDLMRNKCTPDELRSLDEPDPLASSSESRSFPPTENTSTRSHTTETTSTTLTPSRAPAASVRRLVQMLHRHQ